MSHPVLLLKEQNQTEVEIEQIEDNEIEVLPTSKTPENSEVQRLKKQLHLKDIQIQELKESNMKVASELKRMKDLYKNALDLYESNAVAGKLKEKIVTFIFLADPSSEDLNTLLNEEADALLEKYEKIIEAKHLDRIQLEETVGLDDFKEKESYKKQQNEIFEILDIPAENRNFSSLLMTIKELKESSKTKHEDVETDLYSNAQSTLESFLGAVSLIKNETV